MESPTITSPASSGVRARAASLALVATVGLTALKLGVGALSGSVGVLSEGIHSFLDLVSAAISYFTVREAGKPADYDHPFGHGRIETLSSLFEALMLVAAAMLILYEAIVHIRSPRPIHYEGLAIGVILVSLVVSFVVYRHNLLAARESESSALHVNALHFLSDVIASAGILLGLVILKFTGWLVIDPLIAFAVAAYILSISARQVKVALAELSDIQLPEPELQAIRGVLSEFRGPTIEAHDLRTRKVGPVRHIDFHLVVCGHMTVQDSHSICDRIEERIMSVYPRASVNIHVEPCETDKTGCSTTCPVFSEYYRRIGARKEGA